MPTSPEAAARTRAFARVIGPWLSIVPAIIAVRAPDLGAMTQGFFQTPIIVWITGALLLFCGLLIIAFHPYWSGTSAILISLFGWFLALRGFALLAFPGLFERAVDDTAGATGFVRAGFAGLVLIGLWLTYEGWLRKPPH